MVAGLVGGGVAVVVLAAFDCVAAVRSDRPGHSRAVVVVSVGCAGLPAVAQWTVVGPSLMGHMG